MAKDTDREIVQHIDEEFASLIRSLKDLARSVPPISCFNTFFAAPLLSSKRAADSRQISGTIRSSGRSRKRFRMLIDCRVSVQLISRVSVRSIRSMMVR